MVLYLSVGAIVNLSSSVPTFIGSMINFFQYFKAKHKYNLYLALTFLFVFIWQLLEGLATMLIKQDIGTCLILAKISVFILAPLTFFVAIVVDMIDKESVDIWKMVVASITSTALLIFLLDENAIYIDHYPMGELGLFLAPEVYISLAILALFTGGMFVYYMAKMNFKTPKDLKKYSRLLLTGALIMGLGAPLVTALRIRDFIPGSTSLAFACGAFISAIAFVRQPKLAYILPFKVLRLSIIDTEGGILLYNYTWSKRDDLINDELFSSMLQGISLILNEAVKQGDVEEIKLNKAFLFLKRSHEYPVACVLVATKPSGSIREGLEQFASRFFEKFKNDFSPPFKVGKFESASELIEETFPFIPHFD
ncbi:MAG: hypothetical protein ACFFCS_05865 [Candidatus Hodarchaeota archaeon]